MLEVLRESVRSRPELAWLRLARLNLLSRTGVWQDLVPLIATDSARWSAALQAARSGKRVIVATTTGGHFGMASVDRFLALALTLRGANVATVFCDGLLPGCQMCEFSLVPDAERFAERGPPPILCNYCYGAAARTARPLGLLTLGMSDFVDASDRLAAASFVAGLAPDAIGTATWEGLPVGEHALAGTLRYFARATLDEESQAEKVLRRFCEAAVLAAMAYTRIFEVHRPDIVVAHHGIYVPQGIVAALARARGIRLVTWNPAYRRKCFIFSHDDTYHHTLMEEPTAEWSDRVLARAERDTIVRYLESRRLGTQDWIRFHKVAAGDEVSNLGLAGGKPLIAAFTNVFWDAQLHYRTSAFKNQLEWLIDTVEWARSRPDLQLVVRIHPAELSGSPRSRQFAADEIRKAFPALPANVTIVGPERTASSYELAERADTALIYATKMGVELSAMGIPVIVAGEAWVRNKGITEDAISREHYRALLDTLPRRARSSPQRQERALSYAHHFFFRRMIAIAAIQESRGPRRFSVIANHLRELAQGSDTGLDSVCRGILDGTPFHHGSSAETADA